VVEHAGDGEQGDENAGDAGVAADQWMSIDKAVAKAEALGYAVSEAKRSKGSWEIEGYDRNGAEIESLVASLPTLHHVVNCAGVIRRGAEHDPQVFADVIDINLTGTMRVCAAGRAKLAEAKGSIVNTASILSFFGGGLVPGYAASKGGIAQLTKSLAIAYAPDGIRVNAVAPGWIATPLTEALRENGERNAAILARTPLARWGKPEDIAGGVLYLASPLASFVTGTVLAIDGGYMAV